MRPPNREPPPSDDPRGRLEQAVRENHASVWRFLRRLGLSEADADDAIQETILIAAQKLGTVPELSARSFLFGTALRVAHGMFRRNTRRREISDEVLADHPSSQPDLEALTEQKQLREFLDELLGELPYDLRLVFVLYELEEFTVAEISEVLGIPAGTAASRLRRARLEFETRVERAQLRQPSRSLSSRGSP